MNTNKIITYTLGLLTLGLSSCNLAIQQSENGKVTNYTGINASIYTGNVEIIQETDSTQKIIGIYNTKPKGQNSTTVTKKETKVNVQYNTTGKNKTFIVNIK